MNNLWNYCAFCGKKGTGKTMKIDRAIEILNPEHREHYDGLDEVNEACRMGMEALELERTRWIPCSERLPKKLEPVNIVWVNREPEPYYAHIKNEPFVGTGYYHNGKWWWYSCVCEDYLAEYGCSECDSVDSEIEITHWMPLPDPPEVTP